MPFLITPIGSGKLAAIKPILLALLSVCFLQAAVATTPGEIRMVKVKSGNQREELSKRIAELVSNKNYVELEKLYSDSISKTFDDDTSSLVAFTEYFESIDPKSEADLDLILSGIESWISATPKSDLARSLHVEFYVFKAWWYRGGTWAKDVKRDKWAPFNANLNQAFSCFRKYRQEGVSTPILWRAAIATGMGLSIDPALAASIFKEANEAFPHNRLILATHLTSLLPRWGGQPGTWEKVLLENFDKNNPDDQKFIYRTASYHICREAKYTFRPPLTWEVLKACYPAAVKGMADDREFNNRYARMCVDQRDFAEADRAFKKIRNYGTWSAWNSKEQLLQYRDLAAAKAQTSK